MKSPEESPRNSRSKLPKAEPSPDQVVRVFFSSPSDVALERAAALRVIALMNRRHGAMVQLEGVFWEDYFFPASADFQSWINQHIPPWECDLVVCVLWSRIGSPLADNWPRRADGTPYESGTVAEFELTLPYARRGAPPDLYTFVKTAPTTERGAVEKQQAAAAQALVEQFIHRWFHQQEVAEGGNVYPFTAGFNRFETTEAFEEQFTRFLEWWLRGKGLLDPAVTWDVHTRGLPYVGLEPFTATHSSVFVGRDGARRICRQYLNEADAAGFPYLLIVGGSGVGKSSLARAGLVADICLETPNEAWTSASILAGPAPVQRLAEALFTADGLGPTLLTSVLPDPAALGAALAADDEELAVTIVARALASMATERQQARGWKTAPRGRLLLVLDQVEALLGIPAQEQRRFVSVLTMLVRSGLVWLIATLRADRIAAMLAVPMLAPLVTREMSGTGAVGMEYKLTAPDAAAIRDIIEIPAKAAGLRFETLEGDGRSLADELRAAVAENRDALPLLQHLLARLFRDQAVARWSVYADIGGLEGTVATAADAAMAALPAEVEAELRTLLISLTADLSEDGAVLARPVARTEYCTTPARDALVTALERERLLVIDDGDQLRVAHEALLRTWPRARNILRNEAELIQVTERLRPLAHDWRATGELLRPGALLASAASLRSQLLLQPGTEEIATFIEASIRADRRARRRRVTLAAVLTFGFAGISVAASAFAVWAERERSHAQAAFEEVLTGAEAAYGDVYHPQATVASGLQTGILDQRWSQLARADQVGALVEQLHNEYPESARITLLRSAHLVVRAKALIETKAVDEARRVLTEDAALIDRVEASDRGTDADEVPVAMTRLLIGARGNELGDLDAAIEQYRRGLKILHTIMDRQPAVIAWQFLSSIVLYDMGDLLERKNDPNGAIATYRESIAYAHRTVAVLPNGLGAQRLIALSNYRVGTLLAARGDQEGALAAWQSAAAVADAAIRDNKTVDRQWANVTTTVYGQIITLLVSRGQSEPAREMASKAFSLIKTFGANAATGREDQLFLARLYYGIGKSIQSIGASALALEAYQESAAVAEPALEATPNDTDWKRIFAVDEGSMADLLHDLGDLEKAAHVYSKEMTLNQQLAGNNRTQQEMVVRDRRDLVDLYMQLHDYRAASDQMAAIVNADRQFLVPKRVLAEDLQDQAYLSLYKHDFLGAKTLGEEAFRLDDSTPRALGTVAYADMFLGEETAALALHRRYRNAILPNGSSWTDDVLQDFKDFRAAGLTSPFMARIERVLAGTDRSATK